MDDLHTLIKALETEKAELLRLIDEAVKGQEFSTAHFHSEAVGYINKQLQILKNLDDESYDKKHFLETGIENLRERLKEEKADNLKAMITRLIADKEKELIGLNQTPKKQKDNHGKTHIKEYLDQLVKGTIRGLRITISKSDNLSMGVRRTRRVVKLTPTRRLVLSALFVV